MEIDQKKHGEKTLEVIQSQKKSFKVKKSHFKSKEVMKSQYPNTKLYIAQKKRKKKLTESNPHKSRTQVVTADLWISRFFLKTSIWAFPGANTHKPLLFY